MLVLTEFEAWLITGSPHLSGEATLKKVAQHSQEMAHLKDETFKSIPENQKIYVKLYTEYLHLRDYFGRIENDVMKTLKKIKTEVKNDAG
jgi:ribulose kinase